MAIKPTASISKEQKNGKSKKQGKREAENEGRHDPVIVPRAVSTGMCDSHK